MLKKEFDNKPLPTWVKPFLYYYKKSLALDEILKAIKPFAKQD